MATGESYKAVWEKIKHTGSASITVSKEAATTIVHGVIETKCNENSARRKMGLIGWSKLTIKRTEISPTMIRVDFGLLYNTKL